MGILALINGLMNPTATGVGYNTHGIAPGAKLDVFTTPTFGAGGRNTVDAIYRARGIDVAQDVSGGNIIADDDRNIVIINNNMRVTNFDGSDIIAPSTVTLHSGLDATLGGIYKTLQVGLADTATQDAYIFPAADGRANNPGITAMLPISTKDTSIAPYSIIVVAAEKDETPCGGESKVQEICLAAPGEYKYRDRIVAQDGTYTYATNIDSTGHIRQCRGIAGGRWFSLAGADIRRQHLSLD